MNHRNCVSICGACSGTPFTQHQVEVRARVAQVSLGPVHPVGCNGTTLIIDKSRNRTAISAAAVTMSSAFIHLLDREARRLYILHLETIPSASRQSSIFSPGRTAAFGVGGVSTPSGRITVTGAKTPQFYRRIRDRTAVTASLGVFAPVTVIKIRKRTVGVARRAGPTLGFVWSAKAVCRDCHGAT